MSAEVKNVSEVVRGAVADIKKTAADVADKLRQRTDEAKLALDMVDQFGSELGQATAELRALLGVNSNSPPSEEEAPPAKKGIFK